MVFYKGDKNNLLSKSEMKATINKDFTFGFQFYKEVFRSLYFCLFPR